HARFLLLRIARSGAGQPALVLGRRTRVRVEAADHRSYLAGLAGLIFDGCKMRRNAPCFGKLRRRSYQPCTRLSGLEVRDYLLTKEANGIEHLLVLRRPNGTQ